MTIEQRDTKRVSLRDRYQALPWWAHFIVFAICAAAGVVAGGVTALVVITLALIWLSGLPPDSLGLQLSPRRLVDFGAGLALGFAMVATIVVFFWLTPGFRLERNPAVTASIWLPGVWFYLKSSIFEELAFRGYGFRLLIESIGFRWAQAVTVVLFAVYHMMNVGMPLVPALLFTGLGSLLFGYAFRRSGGVMLPIGMHAAWNFWQEQLTGSSGRGQPGIWTAISSGPKISFGIRYGVLLLVSAAAAAIIHYSWRRKWAIERVA